MLSNPTNLQRHRQHRRQQSTPTAYDAPKVPILPNLQRNASHRRGMSLDQRRRQSPTQEQHRVSFTNQGFNDTQQHILRETQQQRLARQGQQQPIHHFNPMNNENYLISPIVTPQRQYFGSECMNLYGGSREPAPSSPYSSDINSINSVNPNGCSGSNPFAGNDSPLYPDEGNLTPSEYLDFSMAFDGLQQEDWGATIKPASRPSTGRRISGNIAERVARFEGLAAEQPSSRPLTPPNQNSSSKSFKTVSI
jgi:regulatory protein SWI5